MFGTGEAAGSATTTVDRSMDGKYCVVTGSNSGIGLQVARGLMQRGAHVVMACRNMAACEQAAAVLRGEGLPGSCACRRVDLEDPGSIRAFARQQAAELAGEYQQQEATTITDAAAAGVVVASAAAAAGGPLMSGGGGGGGEGGSSGGATAARVGRRMCCARQRHHVDVLVNNAGVMGVSPAPDGSDRHLAANHLGPYLLTRLLLPHMTHGSRIVNVASRAHYGGSLSLVSGPPGAEAIRNDTHHWWWQYARSKLCNVLFTAELQRRYGHGSNETTATGGGRGGVESVNAAGGGGAGGGGGKSSDDSSGGGGGAGSGASSSGSGSRGGGSSRGGSVGGGGAVRGIGAHAVSPGMVDTGIFRYLLPSWAQWLRAPLRPFVRTPQQGAEVVLYAASSPELEGRDVLFLHDCREMRPSAAARDARLAADLWRVSAALVGLPPEGDDEVNN